MTTTKRICAVDNGGNLDPVLYTFIRSRYNWSIDRLKSVLDLQGYLNNFTPAVLLIFNSKMSTDEEKILRDLKKRSRIPPILRILEQGDYRHDAVMDDFIFSPARKSDLIARIRRLTDSSYNQEIEVTRQYLKIKYGLCRIIGEDEKFVAAVNQLIPIAKIEAPVLILGETGTGKELFARAIHYLSPRAVKPFVAINCGAIPETIFENELFGHAPGAYTDAKMFHKGHIAAADGGTLYLDEINSMPSRAQVKLLRFLQEGKYKPLGSSKYAQADVRIVSSSNIDLFNPNGKTNIRRDLFYRINVFSTSIPPLRKRKSDISLLASHFISKYAKRLNKCETTFSESALHKLMTYDWPGNVRELENIVQKSMVLSPCSEIDEKYIELPEPENFSVKASKSFKKKKTDIIDSFEIDYLKFALLYNNNNVKEAAKMARMDRGNFYRLLRKHKLDHNASHF